MGNHTPDDKLIFCSDDNRLVIVVFGHQYHTVLRDVYTLGGKFPIDKANGNLAMRRLQALVDNKNIAIIDTGFLHGKSFHPPVICRRWMLDQFPVEVDLDILKIQCRGWKPSANSVADKLQEQRAKNCRLLNSNHTAKLLIKLAIRSMKGN